MNNKPHTTIDDWLEGEYPGEGLICILPAGHSHPHIYCRESDLFGQTNNTESVRVLSRIVQQGNTIPSNIA